MSELKKKLSNIKKILENQKKEILEISKALFQEESKKIFDKYPNIKSFSWRQYTPYFNDGNSCEFSANTDDVSINDKDEYENDENEDNKVDEKLYEVVTEFLSNFNEETLEVMFGDHCQVVVTPKSVEVEEYEHD